MMYPVPRYFISHKEQFMQQAQQMGMDVYQVQDFLDSKGICEAQMNIVLDQMNNMNYVNVLKMMVMQQPMMV